MAGLMQQVRDAGSWLSFSGESGRGYQPVGGDGTLRQVEVSSLGCLAESGS
jgi:hypothetical protein